MPYYTGVGSRSTPDDILRLMTHIALKLATMGYTLRSGGAMGADLAFERGASTSKHIFYAKHATPQAMAIAAYFHPAWIRMTSYAQKLHGRNAFQVLGPYLCEPSEFLICWTSDGAETHKQRSITTGGTGTAISIASHYGVPVYNLANKERFNHYTNWVAL
jgi:hypothetical protein